MKAKTVSQFLNEEEDGRGFGRYGEKLSGDYIESQYKNVEDFQKEFQTYEEAANWILDNLDLFKGLFPIRKDTISLNPGRDLQEFIDPRGINYPVIDAIEKWLEYGWVKIEEEHILDFDRKKLYSTLRNALLERGL